MKRKLEERANPLMAQVAALQSSINQYEQINSVMPQLQAEVSTLRWLYSVLNRGEQQMAALGQNIPMRAKLGGINLGSAPDTGGGEADYAYLNSVAGNPKHPLQTAVRRGMEINSAADQIQPRHRRRTENQAPLSANNDTMMQE
jgi:hypothetical protein